MEPGGRFVLYSLPDGRTIADLKLEAEPSLGDITLLQSGGKYFVLSRIPPQMARSGRALSRTTPLSASIERQRPSATARRDSV